MPTRYVLVPGTTLGYESIRFVLVVTLKSKLVDWSVRIRKQKNSDSTYMIGSKLRTIDTSFRKFRRLNLQ